MANRKVIPTETIDGKSEAVRRIEQAERRSSKKLDLGGLGLETVPESISRLTQLRNLDISRNQLTSLPDSLLPLKELEVLDAYVNLLTKVPEWLSQFTELQTLRLSKNALSHLPEPLGQLQHLSVLDLDVNRFTATPECIGSLKQLEDLYFAANGLESIPDWIGELCNLQMLSLNYNRLTTLPGSIGRLQSLEILTLAGNRLTSLPLSLKNLSALRELYLHNNPGLGIPPELLGPAWTDVANGRGSPAAPHALLEYYFRIRPGLARPLNEAKLILVGRGEVGKTSLVNRLVNDKFHGDQVKTEGIQITMWPIKLTDSDDVRLHVWDFGGQEIMHATHQFFLTQRSLYLLVVNGREGAEDVDVQYWLSLIASFGGDSPVIIVLNKIRSHPFDLNRRGLQEKYPGRIRDFIRTDCQDRTGIEELKQAVLRETDRLPHLRDKFPASWFSIKERLSTMTENYIAFDRYRELCRDLGESDEAAQEELALALHCLGLALNYREDRRLRDTRVLNPHWVTNGVYKILNSSLVERNRGELRIGDLQQILDPGTYPEAMWEFLLSLMRRFELCFRFPEPRDDSFLVPELLGKDQPDVKDEFQVHACLNFQYTYQVWPEGVLPRFIVRTHALSTGQHRWRTGVVLGFEGNRALIKADPQGNCILISVTGPVEGRRRLLAVIRSDFERIHADISRLNPRASVPLPEDPTVVVPYDELRVFEGSGVTVIPRVVGGKVSAIEVEKLLNSIELPPMCAGWPVRTFVSYSHKDEYLRAQLDTHLKLFQRLGLIETWHDRRIPPGEEWGMEIDENLEKAQLILLLVSADFLASEYCYAVEMRRALDRQGSGQARVVPIIVRQCKWQSAPFAKLQVLPSDAKPVRLWADRDSAWSNVAEGIKRIITELRERGRDSSPPRGALLFDFDIHPEHHSCCEIPFSPANASESASGKCLSNSADGSWR